MSQVVLAEGQATRVPRRRATSRPETSGIKIGRGPGYACNASVSGDRRSVFSLTPVGVVLAVEEVVSRAVRFTLLANASTSGLSARGPDGTTAPLGSSPTHFNLPSAGMLLVLVGDRPALVVGARVVEGLLTFDFSNLPHRLAPPAS